MLREDEVFQKTLTSYVYIHMFRDKDREAYTAWSRRFKAPVQAIPQINIVKSDGKLVYSQSGTFRDLNRLLTYKAKELSGDKEATAIVAEFKNALKEADGLIDDGKFISAFERLLDFPEGMTLDDKTTRQVRATVKRVEDAAFTKIGEAKKLLEEGDTEGKRLDGAYQLMVIRGGLKKLESVRSKAHAHIIAFNEKPENSSLFQQAGLLASARDALRDGDIDKAKKAYEKLLTDHKNSEAANRAKARLEELDRN